ncbi:hypothetical protein [Aurantivibrio plasticivorans]
MGNPEIRSALIGGISGLIMAVIASYVTIYTTAINLVAEQNKIVAQSISKEREILSTNAAKLLGEISDVISFFDQNNHYDRLAAKKAIAKARRAAFEFSAYTSPEMAFKALAAIEALSNASEFEEDKIGDALLNVYTTQNELIRAIYKEKDINSKDFLRTLENE